jgi:hypothetical protein
MTLLHVCNAAYLKTRNARQKLKKHQLLRVDSCIPRCSNRYKIFHILNITHPSHPTKSFKYTPLQEYLEHKTTNIQTS